MPPVKGKMLKYIEDTMEWGIEAILRVQPVSTTAKKYGVFRITLLYKLRGKMVD